MKRLSSTTPSPARCPWPALAGLSALALLGGCNLLSTPAPASLESQPVEREPRAAPPPMADSPPPASGSERAPAPATPAPASPDCAAENAALRLRVGELEALVEELSARVMTAQIRRLEAEKELLELRVRLENGERGAGDDDR